jgi:phage baseplate assembly protein gpV
MKESPIGVLAEELDDLKKQLYGVYTGVVVPFPDVPPVGAFQGRVKVKIPMADSLEPLYAWARVAVQMAGLAYGTYFIPTPGTEVLVAFENGDIDAPFVIGSLWNSTAPPPVPLPETQIRMIRTPVGNQIVFTEAPPTVIIQSGPTPPIPIPAPSTPASPPPSIMLSGLGVTITSPTSIQLFSGTSSIVIGPAGIMLNAGQSTITISPTGILIQGTPQVQINPAG